MKPCIGIPCEIVKERAWWPPVLGLRQTYIHAVIDAGGLPLLIPLTDQEDVLMGYYERIDGLLLAGGDDIDPNYYGEQPHEHLGETNPLHDFVELVLTRRALADKRPILAICRGLQLLNVALGGTLYQDIPSQYPTTLDHRASMNDAKKHQTDDWTYLAHDISLDSQSRLASLLGCVQIAVNSLHHQAIKHLAPGLRAVGWAPDGIIEAVETKDDSFVVAVQGHPESLYAESDSRWKAMFVTFVEHCHTIRTCG